MNQLHQLGAAIFPTDFGTNLVTGITGAISDNIAVVGTVLAFVVGIGIARSWLNRSIKGRV
jgi:hypothetical protein